MSTKMTIASGEHFHLYTEAFDEDCIYLEMEGVQFEAAYNRVMVPIPVHIWEVIRRFPGIDLSFADMAEDDIRDMVVAAVEERISAWKSAKTTGQKKVRSLAGALIYGDADTSREEQIRLGMEHYLNLRKHRQEIRRAIEALRKENPT